MDAFYRHMHALPEAQTIRAMHDDDLTVSRDKLTVFLTGWLGGPKEYAKKYRQIRLPSAHAHLAIDEAERDAWLLCMRRAVAEQDAWSDDFKAYFLTAVAVPAEKVRRVSAARRAAP